jgi:hypothetical protein
VLVVTLEVNERQGGGVAVEEYRRGVEMMETALANPSLWLLRELLHACWGRRGD